MNIRLLFRNAPILIKKRNVVIVFYFADRLFSSDARCVDKICDLLEEELENVFEDEIDSIFAIIYQQQSTEK